MIEELQLLCDPNPGAEARLPVNVSSVPQRSPFRYPGGKTWCIPQVRRWLASQPERPRLLIDLFCGGGIVALTSAFENLSSAVVMCELDKDVAAVWQCICAGDGDWLANKIQTFDLTGETLIAALAAEAKTTRERAFQTILKNRTFHGGILAKGSAPLKFGDGKGIHSRWYPKTLADRINAMAVIRNKITFINGDAFDVLCQYKNRSTAVWFVDPPYSLAGKKAGNRLYTHSVIDHEKLFSELETLKGDVLATYDNTDEVKALAKKHGFQTKPVAMKGTHNAEMTELLIGRNLDWVR